MRILFAGIIARYPFGGVTWCSLMYLLGLRALGHEVFYIEDTGECVYDPVQNTRVDRPVVRHRRTSTTRSSRSASAIAGRSSTTTARYHGQSADDVARFCADADLFINLSGGSWFWRDEYARIPRRAFIDSDPAFTQLAIAKAEPWYVEFFQRFDHLFTFGVEHRHAGLAGSGRRLHLAQDVAAGRRSTTGAPTRLPRDRFTTVMTWQIESFTDVGGNKDQEFVKFIDLPSRTTQPFELAINGPQTLLREHGWSTVDAMGVSRTLVGLPRLHPAARRRNSASPSTPTWRPGPDGSAIAPSATSPSGRPALVQDTGWTAHLPSGEGLLAFSTPDEALAGIDRINSDYAAPRAARPRRSPRDHFDAARVLPPLLEVACA